ncbi:hypothetical protein BH09SUM1_BH09SUM1_02060 [soil metagenome]
MKTLFKRGVTLIELMVVVVIISILSTIAVGVYTKEIGRAKYAKAHAEIRTLEIAITQYEVDTGQLPPSGMGILTAGAFQNQFVGTTGEYTGSGSLQLALRSSLNGQPKAPLSARWMGPYVDWDYNRLGDLLGNAITTAAGEGTNQAQIHFLDPWGTPYYYIRSDDYADGGGTELPSTNPLAASETYYNPSTVQIVSFGANHLSEAPPNRGTQADDVSNFKSPEY